MNKHELVIKGIVRLFMDTGAYDYSVSPADNFERFLVAKEQKVLLDLVGKVFRNTRFFVRPIVVVEVRPLMFILNEYLSTGWFGRLFYTKYSGGNIVSELYARSGVIMQPPQGHRVKLPLRFYAEDTGNYQIRNFKTFYDDTAGLSATHTTDYSSDCSTSYDSGSSSSCGGD